MVRTDPASVDEGALRADILSHIITRKSNACPMVARLAWHASGTYSTSDGTGGLDGSTMRFGPEAADDANAGLGIIRDMLLPVKQKYPNISHADIWGFAVSLNLSVCPF